MPREKIKTMRKAKRLKQQYDALCLRDKRLCFEQGASDWANGCLDKKRRKVDRWYADGAGAYEDIIAEECVNKLIREHEKKIANKE